MGAEVVVVLEEELAAAGAGVIVNAAGRVAANGRVVFEGEGAVVVRAGLEQLAGADAQVELGVDVRAVGRVGRVGRDLVTELIAGAVADGDVHIARRVERQAAEDRLRVLDGVVRLRVERAVDVAERGPPSFEGVAAAEAGGAVVVQREAVDRGALVDDRAVAPSLRERVVRVDVTAELAIDPGALGGVDHTHVNEAVAVLDGERAQISAVGPGRVPGDVPRRGDQDRRHGPSAAVGVHLDRVQAAVEQIHHVDFGVGVVDCQAPEGRLADRVPTDVAAVAEVIVVVGVARAEVAADDGGAEIEPERRGGTGGAHRVDGARAVRAVADVFLRKCRRQDGLGFRIFGQAPRRAYKSGFHGERAGRRRRSVRVGAARLVGGPGGIRETDDRGGGAVIVETERAAVVTRSRQGAGLIADKILARDDLRVVGVAARLAQREVAIDAVAVRDELHGRRTAERRRSRIRAVRPGVKRIGDVREFEPVGPRARRGQCISAVSCGRCRATRDVLRVVRGDEHPANTEVGLAVVGAGTVVRQSAGGIEEAIRVVIDKDLPGDLPGRDEAIFELEEFELICRFGGACFGCFTGRGFKLRSFRRQFGEERWHREPRGSQMS